VGIKDDLKNIIQDHFREVTSSLFLDKSLAIIDESAQSRESFMAAADKIYKRTELFIDFGLAKRVYEDLTAHIEKSDMQPGQRRRYPRVTWHRDLEVIHAGTSYKLSSEDLSAGGMYLKAAEPFPVGSELRITLPLENERFISVTGTVVFAKASSGAPSNNPPGMGIKFKGLRDEEVKMLKQHVERLLPQEVSGTSKETAPSPRA
jgi:Tfp pilus assembly protein PilZ